MPKHRHKERHDPRQHAFSLLPGSTVRSTVVSYGSDFRVHLPHGLVPGGTALQVGAVVGGWCEYTDDPAVAGFDTATVKDPDRLTVPGPGVRQRFAVDPGAEIYLEVITQPGGSRYVLLADARLIRQHVHRARPGSMLEMPQWRSPWQTPGWAVVGS